MNTYTISKVNGAPDWDKIPSAAIENYHGLARTGPVDIQAWAQVAYTDDALLVRLRAKEKDIRAEEPLKLGMPCNDSCLEFFFCPREGDLHYFNIEYSPACSMYLGYGVNVKTLTRLVSDEIPEQEVFCPQAKRTADGWEISYRMPFEFIRRFFPDFAPKSGDRMRANCYKCGDKTPRPHFLTWNPIPEDVNFHCPEHFGQMIFE